MRENNVYNIKPLMNDIEKVIETGLNKLLEDYMERYSLLERTHNQIMMLPSVELELGRRVNLSVDSEVIHNISTLESKLNTMEKLYDNILPIMNKMFETVTNLTTEINELKKATITNQEHSLHNIEKSSIVKTCENENIKLNIIDDDVDSYTSTIVLNSLKETPNNDLDDTSDVNTEVVEQEEEEDELVKEAEIVRAFIEEKDKQEEEEQEEEEEEQEEQEEQVEEEEQQEDQEEEQVEEEEQEEEQVEEEEEEQEEVEEEQSVETEAKEESESESEQEDKPDDKEEEEELFEIEIDDVTYCTNDDENGFIWELTKDGEQGEKIGYFKEGEPIFYNEEN